MRILKKISELPNMKRWLKNHNFSPANEVKDEKRRYITYGRKSTDENHVVSLERQFANCAAYADRAGLVPRIGKHEYADVGRSGMTFSRREAFGEAMQAIRDGEVDVFLVEDLDRLSRDLGDQGWFWRFCCFHRVEIHAVRLGRVDFLSIVMGGFRASEERKRMAQLMQQGRTLSAQKGQLLRLARCYGYALSGNPARPLRIERRTAAVVQRIFREYAAGKSADAIAMGLNRDGIRSPAGKRWSAAALTGSGATSGILDRTLYGGLETWGRVQTTRDENYKPSRSSRPSQDWVCHAREDLRIVPVDLWVKVQKRLQATRSVQREKRNVVPMERRPDGPLLSGKVRCGCGRPMVYGGRPGSWEQLTCTSFATGEADHPTSVVSADVERRILSILRDRSLSTKENRKEAADSIREKIMLLKGSLESPIPAEIKGIFLENQTRLRQEWQEELWQLEGRLASLVSPEDATTASSDVRSIDVNAQIADFLGPFPLRGRTEEESRFRDHIRDRLGSVVVVPHGKRKGYELRVELATGFGSDLGVGGESERITMQVEASDVGYMADKDFVGRLTKAAEHGTFALDDATWAAVEPIFEPLAGIKIGPRRLADAALFLALTRMPRRRAPACFGPSETLMEQLRRMGSLGIWRRLVERLQTLGWPYAAGLEPAEYDPAPPAQRAAGRAERAIRGIAVLLEARQRNAAMAARRQAGKHPVKQRRSGR